MKINKIEKKDGTFVYRTNVYLGVDSLTGKQVRTTVTAKTRKMCEMKANQAINNFIKNGSTIAREKTDFETFEDLALDWFESYKLTVKENSIRVAKNYLKVYILPEFGSYRVDKITSILIQSIINKWAKNANTSKIVNGKRERGKCKDYKLLLNFIKRILDYGMQLGAVEDNPATKVFPPKLKIREVPKIKYFDNDELKKFMRYLDELEPNYNNKICTTLYRLLLASGLRIGEALALYWSDIDFNEGSVSVSKTIVQTITDRNKIQDGAKTVESNRVVSLDSETIIMLKEWRKFQKKNIVELSDSLIFYRKQGKCLIYANEIDRLRRHFECADVPNIGFHGFRHTHASLLMNNDVNPKEIQKRLGHADYAITMNTYSHLAKSKEKETAEKFGSILKAL
ncbi:site-specific integrase [Lactococcus lactis]|uniref:tyrosine-type recombinase/integrase n=1 Tax=Lactococcus lactis TaxID=1358 RepID=UPI00241856ED|nr:site-specific integrase [Lactococcus lactis]MDG4965823.1 site-specific integrase [Lactococcus lactis]